MINFIFTIILFVASFLFSYSKDNALKRSNSTIGINFKNINILHRSVDYNQMLELNWTEYENRKDNLYFTPFYNLSIGSSINAKSRKEFWNVSISPGVRVNLGSWSNEPGEKFIFYDFELSSGIFGTKNDKKKEAYIGLKSEFNLIVEYQPINFKIGMSVYSNMPFSSAYNFSLNYFL